MIVIDFWQRNKIKYRSNKKTPWSSIAMVSNTYIYKDYFISNYNKSCSMQALLVR